MHRDEFISRIEGVPWSNRACSFDAADCWGLVVMYYRHVLGIEVHQTADYESGRDFMTCYDADVVFWQRSETFCDEGIFVAWVGSQPVHVGLIFDGRALHSRGENGHVRFDAIRTIQKLFTRVEFYTYADYRNSASSGDAEGQGSS
ncbi:NlpC/P60 family protein [Enterobacter ludwigii]|uniref:NlpC/P60 family protein n=1 Tax=Enterobacter ludwigii TaxID=299767 RepID=UPI001C8B9916|nr:NlpC/P60 family protein [Enterobacter ludwigii]ELN9421084.1 C40 family peptidase [Enterobacter ludwigii]MBX8877347.1 peptidoglycan endopeptidase [Enterobacter ludwigii]MDC7312649.1 NlpC/P60 family protein [Enterobacter ludwigii]MDI0402701.1 NlpC/P60 family protein [Enterobacter ludwigii]MDI0410664.1 NlpC/P60 family protein [Enterobacter ludwigii]